jgi:hypothetical protein
MIIKDVTIVHSIYITILSWCLERRRWTVNLHWNQVDGQGHCHLGNDKVCRQNDGLKRVKDDYQGCHDISQHLYYHQPYIKFPRHNDFNEGGVVRVHSKIIQRYLHKNKIFRRVVRKKMVVREVNKKKRLS